MKGTSQVAIDVFEFELQLGKILNSTFDECKWST
jgi:hypothetical protein